MLKKGSDGYTDIPQFFLTFYGKSMDVTIISRHTISQPGKQALKVLLFSILFLLHVGIYSLKYVGQFSLRPKPPTTKTKLKRRIAIERKRSQNSTLKSVIHWPNVLSNYCSCWPSQWSCELMMSLCQMLFFGQFVWDLFHWGNNTVQRC